MSQHLVDICLSQIGVVRELFYLLDNFSTLDVGCRFLNLIPSGTLLRLVSIKDGKAFCEILLSWMLYTKPVNNSGVVCEGVDYTIQLLKLKNAINKAPDTSGESPYYTIDASIILEADAIVILDKIAPLYFAKTGKKFNVNSGTRNSYRQADAMYDVYMNGDKTLHLYRNKIVINELLEIIKSGQKSGESRTAIVKKMTDLIQKYFEKNILLSGHQKAGAIDIDINGDVGIAVMSDVDIKIMMEIAFKVTGFKALLEKSPPHLHIKFK